MRNPVTVHKRKFDGSTSWTWDGDLLDEDGAWLVVYHGEGRHERRRPGRGPEVPAAHALQYLSLDAPLAVSILFDRQGGVIEYQCDACLPAQVDGARIDFVDLDVDVVAAPDLSWRIKDVVEFRLHAREMGYDGEAIDAAREGVRMAIECIERREMPFDGGVQRLPGVVRGQGS